MNDFVRNILQNKFYACCCILLSGTRSKRRCTPICGAQWRTQKIFMGGFHSVAYGGHLYLMCAVCDVTIWRHAHVSKPTFWPSLLT